MVDSPDSHVRLASADDAAGVGRLLHDFNTEFSEPTPGPEQLARRITELLEAGDTDVLVAGVTPAGLAVLRYRPSIWTPGLECYLAELYVRPAHRGHGLGRALMVATIARARTRGADGIDLGTEETDTAARALYESLGFTNTGGRPGGAVSYFYELEL